MKRWCLMERGNRRTCLISGDICRMQHYFFLNISCVHNWGKNLSWCVCRTIVTIQVNQEHRLEKKQKNQTVLWKLYKAILTKAYCLHLSPEHLSALWECCYHGTVTVIPGVCFHHEPVLHFWWLYLACKLLCSVCQTQVLGLQRMWHKKMIKNALYNAISLMLQNQLNLNPVDSNIYIYIK